MKSCESTRQVNQVEGRKTTIPIQCFQTSKIGLDVALRDSRVLISTEWYFPRVGSAAMCIRGYYHRIQQPGNLGASYKSSY